MAGPGEARATNTGIPVHSVGSGIILCYQWVDWDVIGHLFKKHRDCKTASHSQP